MSELPIIIGREFKERVQSRNFLLGTILFPVFMVVVTILPSMFDRGGSERHIVVVDEAPPGVVDRIVGALTQTAEGDLENRYTVERVRGPFDAVRNELNDRVLAEEIYGYVVIPAGVVDGEEVVLRASAVASFSVLRDVRRAVTRSVQAERLQRAGVEIAELASLLTPVPIQTARVTPTGEDGAGAESSFLLAYIIAFLLYMMIAFYGMNVLRSVLEEKTNRIAEVLVSSVAASRLMLGKVVGVSSAAMLQVLIWFGSIALLVTRSDWLTARFNIPPEALDALRVDPMLAIVLIAFFILGFFLYASLFAALGAAVTSDQEAQSLQMVVMLPLFVPLLFLVLLTTEPLGTVATVLGLVPFTAPMAMPMRMAAANVPGGQVLLSLVLVLVGLIVVGWLAGKIYRIGILSTGKKPTLKELVRWLRMA